MAEVTLADVTTDFGGVALTGSDEEPIAIEAGGFVLALSLDEALQCWRELDAAIGSLGRPIHFDLIRHLHRQRTFSKLNFGPGMRTAGVCDHIRKELQEIEAEPGELGEWVDVILLALDGAWRTGAAPEQIAAAIIAKQIRNEARKWPDWRTQDPDKAIEHDRSAEVA